MNRRSRDYSVQGIPAFILVILPAIIGWVWIINALFSAVTP